jgi:hypothetical protein
MSDSPGVQEEVVNENRNVEVSSASNEPINAGDTTVNVRNIHFVQLCTQVFLTRFCFFNNKTTCNGDKVEDITPPTDEELSVSLVCDIL